MKSTAFNFLFATLSLIASENPTAILLFDGGAPDGSSGLPLADVILFVPADDFIIGNNPWQLTRVDFWTKEDARFTWSGEIQYWFFNDNGGAPDGLPLDNYVATGFGQSITKTMLEATPSVLTIYDYKLLLGQQVTLPSDSTYLLGLGLHVHDLVVANTQAYGASTRTGFGSGSYSLAYDPSVPFSGWLRIGLDLAFQLGGNGVPIPPPATSSAPACPG
jgi:hypothetical protein